MHAVNSDRISLGALIAALSSCLLAWGCAHESQASRKSSRSTEGGESAIDSAGRNIDAAHRDFQRAVKPVADVVDEKSRVIVNEGKKAANKVAGGDTHAD